MTQSVTGVPGNSLYAYVRTRLFGADNNANRVFNPQRQPIMDEFGGGSPYNRQLHLFSANMVMPQSLPTVSILGAGTNPQGQYTGVPLIDVSNQ